MPSLNVLFWAFFASYVVHILDETLLNGGFVRWIADNFWPTYHMRMFFWFNAAFIAAIGASNVLFDGLGGHWVILPLIFVAGFATHAFTVHLAHRRRQIALVRLEHKGRQSVLRGWG